MRIGLASAVWRVAATLGVLLALGVSASGASAAPGFSKLSAEMSEARYEPATGLLPNGKVLIAGGYDGAATPNYQKGADLFDPSTGTFEKLSAELNVARDEAASVTLPDGRVLIAGGDNETSKNLGGAELFNPASGKFELIAAEMTTARGGGEAALLPNGKVLIVGGEGALAILKSAELYNPATQTFEPVPGEMSVARWEPSVATLPNGKVLVAGGWNKVDKFLQSAELFDPATGTFEKLEGPGHELAEKRGEAGFTALANGKILMAGGFNDAKEQLKTVELFNPETSTFELLGTELSEPRDGPSAVLLPGGKVLLAGGYSGKVDLKTAELRAVEAPFAVTAPAAAVGRSAATLAGTDLAETASTVRFQYGTTTAYGSATPDQTVAASILQRPVSAPAVGLVPATVYHFRIVAENAGGTSYGADQTFTTLPPPPPVVKRLPAVLLQNVTQSHSVWRLGHALARFARTRAPVGTRFSFTLNQPATVTFAFTQQLGGRRVHGKCVAQTKANRHRRACRRTLTRGTLSFAGHTGRNRVTFQGRISRTRTLKPGTYTLAVTGTNAQGLRSSTRRLTFKIVR